MGNEVLWMHTSSSTITRLSNGLSHYIALFCGTENVVVSAQICCNHGRRRYCYRMSSGQTLEVTCQKLDCVDSHYPMVQQAKSHEKVCPANYCRLQWELICAIMPKTCANPNEILLIVREVSRSERIIGKQSIRFHQGELFNKEEVLQKLDYYCSVTRGNRRTTLLRLDESISCCLAIRGIDDSDSRIVELGITEGCPPRLG